MGRSKIVEKSAAHGDALALSDADAKRWGNLRPHVPEANFVQRELAAFLPPESARARRGTRRA